MVNQILPKTTWRSSKKETVGDWISLTLSFNDDTHTHTHKHTQTHTLLHPTPSPSWPGSQRRHLIPSPLPSMVLEGAGGSNYCGDGKETFEITVYEIDHVEQRREEEEVGI